MAWVTQKFSQGCMGVELGDSYVQIDSQSSIFLAPLKKEDARAWAMMLRRAARRLEEIGKGLP